MKYMIYKERIELERLLKSGKSVSEIARIMNRSRRGIYYEFSRSGMNRNNYNAEKAQLSVDWSGRSKAR